MGKNSGSNVEGGIEVDPTTGKFGVSVKLSLVENIMQAFHSPTTIVARAFAERIAGHLTSGNPLDELSPAEQAFVIEAIEPLLVKAANRRAVISRALKHDSGIAGLLAAPTPLQSGQDEPGNREKTEEHQYFWERFWADAEITSVAYMQEHYSRLLEGKIKDPSAFSLRTLDTLRCMDLRTATAFAKVAPLFVQGSFIPIFYGCQYYPLLTLLIEEGLLSANEDPMHPDNELVLGAWRISLKRMPDKPYAKSASHALTRAGRELLSLNQAEVGREHVFEICRVLGGRPTSVRVAENPNGPWVDWQHYFATELAQAARTNS